jgi:hypothetical protein
MIASVGQRLEMGTDPYDHRDVPLALQLQPETSKSVEQELCSTNRSAVPYRGGLR